MTKPFSFTSLESADVPPVPDRPIERNDKVIVEENDAAFPPLAFELRQAKDSKSADPTYTAQDLEAALEEARRTTAVDVEAQTRAAMFEEHSHRQAQAMEAIRDQFQSFAAALEAWMSDADRTVHCLAKMMGQAVVPRALERQPLADIADMTRESLWRLADQPTIEVRLESESLEEAAGLLDGLAEETGFQGTLTAVADPALDLGEVRLVWKNGVAERDLGRIKEEVDMLVDAWLDNRETHSSELPLDTPFAPDEAAHESSEERSAS